MRLFLDTSAILALLIKNDQHHDRAVAFLERSARARFTLTELILSEVVTRVRARTNADLAVDAARRLMSSRRHSVVFMDAELLEQGLVQMARFKDKQLSLTDAVSFAAMNRFELDTAFSFDRDFRDCGFRMVP
ncbi:MAG: PIN domain-containing protein [Deltaproteobacteria bacterium]|nr:PIN domain-containing protein [Deltaproteobacteria bacterium]